MRVPSFLLLTLLLASSATAQTANTLLAGQILGRGQAPLGGAEIVVVGRGEVATSDSMGKFRLALPAGTYIVRVRRIGFRAAEFSAQLAADAHKEVKISLEPGVYELPEIAVEARNAKPIEYAWTTRYDEFFHRKKVGLGHFFTRNEIERLNPYQLVNLVTRLPRTRVQFRRSPGGMSETSVDFQGCQRISVWLDGWKLRQDAADTAAMVVNGMAISRAGVGVGRLLEEIPVSEIEMVEIYRSVAEMPAEFLDDSCGAIALWRR